jgi:hypothetical protein
LNHIQTAATIFVYTGQQPCLPSILARLRCIVQIFGGSLLGLWQETGNTGNVCFYITQQFAELEQLL